MLVVALAARISDTLPRGSLATLRSRGASMGLPVPGEWSRLCGLRRGRRVLCAARGLCASRTMLRYLCPLATIGRTGVRREQPLNAGGPHGEGESLAIPRRSVGL